MTLQWFEFAFKIKGTVAPIVLPRVFIFTGFAIAVSIFHHYEPQISLKVLGDITNNVVFNLVLGLLLVFRTNTAYDRYWEGRKAWGTLVVNIRNLSRLMQIAIASSEGETQQQKERAIKYLNAFAIATKRHSIKYEDLLNSCPPLPEGEGRRVRGFLFISNTHHRYSAKSNP
jgi:putative membrane protein